MRGDIVWPLVGRDEEIAVLTDLLDDPGRPGLVIAGNPGTGKTRLALEALKKAREKGWPAMSVAATSSAASIPLGAFAPLLSSDDPGAVTFQGLRQAAEAIADGDRTMVVVDDAHHLDPASATLLHHLAMDPRVLVVATVRSRAPAPDAVVALWKDGLAIRLELGKLSHDESATLLKMALSADVDAAAAHELWVASSGNPLFLRELVRAAVAGGVLVEDNDVWMLNGRLQVPSTIEDLVGVRLGETTPPEQDALYALAFAETIGLDLLRQLHPRVDMARLEQRGLIRLDHDGRRRPVTLTHPMYGQVLRERAPGTLAVQVARLFAGAIEGHGARRREDALRVATWRLEAGGETDSALAATAAQQSYHAGDFELAERLARSALSGHRTPSSASLLLAQLLDERGEHAGAEAWSGSIDTRSLSPEARMRSALLRSDNLFFGLGREEEAQRVLAEAERIPGISTAEVTANRAWIELHTGQVAAALARVGSVEPASTEGRVAVGIVKAWTLALLGDTTGALHTAEQAACLEDAPTYTGVSRHEGFLQLARCHANLCAGLLDEAARIAEAGLAGTIDGSPAFLRARWTTLLGGIGLERGHVATAVSWFRQAAALQHRLRQFGLLRANLAGLALAAAQAGDVPEAAATIRELDQLPATPERLFDVDALLAGAWTAAARGERSTAIEILRDTAALASEAGLVPIEARVQHDLVRLGDLKEAAARLAELSGLTDSATVDARARHAAACVSGDPEQVEVSARTLEHLGLELLAAEAFASAATGYRREGRRRAHGCVRRAADLRRRCEKARSPAMRSENLVAPLTPREREVVTMAAGGLPSKLIAERLDIKTRTVDNLIQRAYVKLGVHSRDEASEELKLDSHQSLDVIQ
jgi:DNA-binding CsgD family transcriptional regulator